MVVEYIWAHKNWRQFRYERASLSESLDRACYELGVLDGKLSYLSEDQHKQALVEALASEVCESSRIEGVYLDRDSVRQSLLYRLGIEQAGVPPTSGIEDNVVQILIDATLDFNQNLTAKRLKGWHAALFPTGYSDLVKITIGKWRSDETGVAEGPMNNPRYIYKAPPPETVAKEMKYFFQWFNNSRGKEKEVHGLVRAAIAHYWFDVIHPFDDGNGRIARAVAEMALAQYENNNRRCYSMSPQIEADRKNYYHYLDKTSKGDGDINDWLLWFLGCYVDSVRQAQSITEGVLHKTRFWDLFRETNLNDRQKKVITKLLDAGPDGFEGGLKTKKYCGMTKTSKATAQRDIADLLQKGVLRHSHGQGRSTTYELVWLQLPKG